MAELRPGMTVALRKAKLSPFTMTGRPMLNTYAPLDYVGCTKELQMKVGANGVFIHRQAQMPAVPSVRICKAMNRTTIHRDRFQHAFDRARILSLQIDSEQREHRLDQLLSAYNEHVDKLKRDPRRVLLNKLIHLEQCRGVRRAVRV